MRREHPREVPIAEAPLARAKRASCVGRPRARDALVRRQVPQTRERDDPAPKEPAARHVVVGHLRERVVQHLLRRHRHRRASAPVRPVPRGLRARGRGAGEGSEVRVRARARERRRERRERLHRDLEQPVHVPARRAMSVHERLALRPGRVRQLRRAPAAFWGCGPTVRAAREPAPVSARSCARVLLLLLLLLLLLFGRCPTRRCRPLALRLTMSVVVLEDRRLRRLPPQTQQQLRIDPLEGRRTPSGGLMRQVLAPRWGPLARVPRPDLPRLVRKRRRAPASARRLGSRRRDDRADPVHDPRVRDSHRRRVGQVRVRDTIAHVLGVRWQALRLLLALIPASDDRLAALDVRSAEQQPTGRERGHTGFVGEAHVEDVDGERTPELGCVPVKVRDKDRPAHAVGNLYWLSVFRGVNTGK